MGWVVHGFVLQAFDLDGVARHFDALPILVDHLLHHATLQHLWVIECLIQGAHRAHRDLCIKQQLHPLQRRFFEKLCFKLCPNLLAVCVPGFATFESFDVP